ncbi:MAG: LysM peptidoglycan-binding domain-containing protein [Spirochaetota bacterium]|nr:LysM peptidoglycan-binding domain-containing protein [Spirochaetota bacterium]
MLFIIFIISLFLSTTNIYSNNYTIQRNESLWEIANKKNITLSDLRKLNDLYSDNVLIGQKIYVPSYISNYTVKTEDSFQSIAKFFDTQIKHIITLNNLSENHVIEGQVLKIPITKNDPITLTKIDSQIIKTQPITYKVKKGDTLSDVALKYRTSIAALKKLNQKNSSSIYIGEQLIVGNKVIPQKNTIQKTIHKVKIGETLGQIAINYKVSLRDILDWNNKTKSSIYINEILTIYSKNISEPKNSNLSKYKNIKYTVRNGENLSYIAAKFGTSPFQIKTNNNKNNDKLLVGEILNISVKVTKNLEQNSTKKDIISNKKLIQYKVRRGDTLDDISIKYNISRSQLLSWNNKKNTRIYIGEVLKIYITDKSVPKSTGSKSSKKAEYIKSKSGTGIRTTKFENIPLPIKLSQVVSTTPSGRGINIILKSKSTIEAPIKATVQYAGYINTLQNVVILKISNNRTIVYAGMDRLNVKTGQNISKGHPIGSIGMNNIDNTHKLYLEMRDKEKVVNVLYSYKELAKKQK